MNQGPTYFNQPPSGVPQPPNSPYQPGFTGFQAQPQPPAGNGAGNYQQPYQTAYRQPVPGQARPQQPYQTAYQQPVPGQARPQQPYQTAYQQPVPGQMRPQQPYQTAYQQPVPGQMRPQQPYQTAYQQPAPGQMRPQQPYQTAYQQPAPGQMRPQQPYQTAYQQPAPGAYSTAYQPSPYQRQGYPYQVNGVPQQAQPPVYSQYMQPVPPPQQYQPATHVDVDGVGRLIVYLALPVLAVLFVVGMAVSGLAWMKWLFTGLAAVVALMLWVRPLLRDDIKITLSCVLGALAVVAVVSALSSAPADAKQPAAQTTANVLSQPSVTPDIYAGIASGVEVTPAPVVPTAAPASSGMQSEAVERMESFLYFWSVNNLDSMITLCAPSWVKKQDKPMESLYRILANRTPTEYNATAISGTDNDLSRTITVSISLHRNNGNAPKIYQFKVIMVREEEMWYLDPASLESNEEATATPASAVITQMPTPAPIADANQLLFYNPDGGSYYHLDAYCKSANARNLPFKGSFTYGQLNDAAYVNLISCPVCAAPKRPAKN